MAVDGSEGSLRAAAMAARLIAGPARAGVDLVHVHPWLVKEAAEVELPRRGWHATAAARAAPGRSGHRVARCTCAWARRPRRSWPWPGNSAAAGIAIGSRGLTATESLFLGSVAYKVVHLGNVPVLIVR